MSDGIDSGESNSSTDISSDTRLNTSAECTNLDMGDTGLNDAALDETASSSTGVDGGLDCDNEALDDAREGKEYADKGLKDFLAAKECGKDDDKNGSKEQAYRDAQEYANSEYEKISNSRIVDLNIEKRNANIVYGVGYGLEKGIEILSGRADPTGCLARAAGDGLKMGYSMRGVLAADLQNRTEAVVNMQNTQYGLEKQPVIVVDESGNKIPIKDYKGEIKQKK